MLGNGKTGHIAKKGVDNLICLVYNASRKVKERDIMSFDAVCAVIHGHYKEEDDYVIIDEHDNVQSFTNWDDEKSPVDIDILANWLFETER